MRNLTAAFVLAALLLAAPFTVARAQATDPIAILKSDAPLKDKQEACRKLSIKGPLEAVPVLAALLGDEKLAHMARYALEPMPYPEAGKALRDALGTTHGLLKVGVINSLAIRKDEQAVPELVKLLPGDSEVARTAAEALGVIATPEAEKGLEDALAQPNMTQGKLNSLCDALLGVATKLAQKEPRDQAVKIYDLVLQTPKALPQVQTAALRGAVLSRGVEKGLPLLVERIRGENVEAFASALLIARELSGNKSVTAALAGELAAASATRKIRMLDVFGDTDGDSAGEAVMALAKEGDVDVRVAAIRALTKMHYSPVLALVAQMAWNEDGKLAEAARNSLAYFPGKDGDVALESLLHSEQAKARKVAVELIGQGGLDNPIAFLMKAADTDEDENVRVAALDGLHAYAGVDEMPGLLNKLVKARTQPEMRAAESTLVAFCDRQKQMPGAIVVQKATYGDPPADVLEKVSKMVAAGTLAIEATTANFGDPTPGKVKRLAVTYTENGTPISTSVDENETLRISVATAPAAVVDAFCAAYDQAQGDAKIAMLRLLGAAGSPKALALVRAAVSADGPAKDTAVHALCDWPTPDALPAIIELAKASADVTLKDLALRGAVRLLADSRVSGGDRCLLFDQLLVLATSSDEKKMVLGGLAQSPVAFYMDFALEQICDPAVKSEAVQAALAIAKVAGRGAREDKEFFNGKDLTGWQGNMKFWRFEDGAIANNSAEPVAQNEFLWSNVQVKDFYLAVDIMLDPDTGNGGVQFRSKKIDERGQALGYQGDVGKDVWGRLYHEHGRGKLDWSDEAEKAVKPGQWNHYEILAVGPAIWIAINGKLGAAYLEPNKDERSGLVAVQLHAGPPQKLHYRFTQLTHNPKIALDKMTAKDLIAALRVAGK